jgi:hypothetical protein
MVLLTFYSKPENEFRCGDMLLNEIKIWRASVQLGRGMGIILDKMWCILISKSLSNWFNGSSFNVSHDAVEISAVLEF